MAELAKRTPEEVFAHHAQSLDAEELVADLLSIVTVFSGRLSASRAKHIRSCVECTQATV